ncbi:MAG: hypothetical protein HZA65_07720 [Rhodocyclales bacterium]|nr:hypothetical protein [Rhodocyclales bacterium]
MQSSPLGLGASASVRSVSPSLDLAKLVELLCTVLDAEAETGTPPFLSMQGRKLCINSCTVLHRLVTSDDFKSAFTPSTQDGFIRDMTMPGKGIVARIGGRLLHSTESTTSRAIEKLHSLVAAKLDSVLSGTEIGTLVLGTTEEGIRNFARSVAEDEPQPPSSALMIPLAFAPGERSAQERSKDIGRVLTAIETVDGRDSLDLMLKGIENRLRKEERDDEDVEDIISCIRAQRHRPGSLIREFIDFLEDEALARMRLQVTMRIMQALATQSASPGFKEYVRRVHECYVLFAGPKGASLPLSAETVFGKSNNSDLAEHLRTALFYSCLPVWPQWSAQLFEGRTETTQGFATMREVSYRFRVNGKNPETGKSAFDTRMERFRQMLLDEAGPNSQVRRDLAELLFLHLVIPCSLDDPGTPDVLSQAKLFASKLKGNPSDTIRKALDSLASRSHVVDALAKELIQLLKNRSNKVISLTNASVDNFRIFFHRDIVNWEAIDSINEDTDFLVKSQKGDHSIEWFRHLIVSEDEIVPGSLFSYSVKTRLQERNLAPSGDGKRLIMKHDLSSPLLAVRFIPTKWEDKEKTISVPDLQDHRIFDARAGVDLYYNLKLLQLNKGDKGNEDERKTKEQLRAASVSAFTLLAYVTLYEIQRRVRAQLPDAGIAMLRLQYSGRQSDRKADAEDGNTAIYAASHAIEKALAREGFVKLQGVTTSEADSFLRWKKRGALHALFGGQKLLFPFEGSLDRVALITYVTRPCDAHPDYPDADGHLFLSHTYVAERGLHGGTLKTLYMRSRLVESRKDFKSPQIIMEEIARLHRLGFRHVMLLSHHFGNRHIGRAAERHAPHGTLQFLDEAFSRFPDIYLYPLRRDVFPAMRLRKRSSKESGFEMVHFEGHKQMYESIRNDIQRSVTPIYTFATLVVVGDENERPQSGFCTYFLDDEQRITDVKHETVRHNILGISNEAAEVRKSLISVLRAIHFMESEKAFIKTNSSKESMLPVLDPYGWVNPSKRAAAGEIEIMARRRTGSVFLSLPAVLAHVTKVLHKEDE